MTDRRLQELNVLRASIANLYENGPHFAVKDIRGQRLFKADTLVSFRGTDFTSLGDIEFLAQINAPNHFEPPTQHPDISRAFQVIPSNAKNIVVTGHSAGAFKARALVDLIRSKGLKATYIGFNGEVPFATRNYVSPLEKNDKIIRSSSEWITNPEVNPGRAKTYTYDYGSVTSPIQSHTAESLITGLRRIPQQTRTLVGIARDVVKQTFFTAYRYGSRAVRSVMAFGSRMMPRRFARYGTR